HDVAADRLAEVQIGKRLATPFGHEVRGLLLVHLELLGLGLLIAHHVAPGELGQLLEGAAHAAIVVGWVAYRRRYPPLVGLFPEDGVVLAHRDLELVYRILVDGGDAGWTHARTAALALLRGAKGQEAADPHDNEHAERCERFSVHDWFPSFGVGGGGAAPA